MAKQNENSRQQRARRNRAQREALKARKAAAASPRAQRVPAAVEKSASTKSAKSGQAPRPTARQALAQGRLGQVPVDIDTLEGSFLGKVIRVPGGMQMLMATVLVLVLTVMGVVMNTLPEEGAEQGAAATRTLVDAYGAGAILFLAPPVILVGNALIFGLHARRRRMWTISAVMLGAFSILMLQYVFPAGFLGYAALRSKRIEEGPRLARRTDPDDVEGAEDATNSRRSSRSDPTE